MYNIFGDSHAICFQLTSKMQFHLSEIGPPKKRDFHLLCAHGASARGLSSEN